MEILVDERTYEPEAVDTLSTVADLARQVSGRSSGRLVVGLRCDGQAVPEDALEAALGRPMRDFQRLELHTQPVRALVASAMHQAVELFAETDGERVRAADLLNRGDCEEAMHALQRMMEGWRQVQQTLMVCADTLKLPLDHMTVQDRPVPEVLEGLKAILTELRQAMQARDLVLVGDLLRYELEAPFADWRLLLEQARAAAMADDPADET